MIEDKDVIGVKEVLFFFLKKKYHLVICSSVRLWIKNNFHRLTFIFVDDVSITNSLGLELTGNRKGTHLDSI